MTKAPRNPIRRRHRFVQRGATLIEILIAVLILSLGLLSMAALQTRALQGNQSSVQRSQAVMLANYMMDAMRIDRVNAQGLNYNTGGFQCSGATFSGTTLQDVNRKHWLESAQANLGVASDATTCGSITCGIDFVCTVRVRWDDSKADGKTPGLGLQTIEIQSRL